MKECSNFQPPLSTEYVILDEQRKHEFEMEKIGGGGRERDYADISLGVNKITPKQI